jgi:hypothetical protein
VAIRARKFFWWAALGFGLGGIAEFFILFDDLGFPQSSYYAWPLSCFSSWWCWPIIAILLTGYSFIRLRHWYRVDPETKNGPWQLSLSDLLGSVAYFGFVLISWRLFDETYALIPAIPVTCLLGGGYVIGLVLGNKRGETDSIRRGLSAIGASLMGVGSMGLGGFLFLLATVLISDGSDSVPYAIDYMLGRANAASVVMRWSLCALPTGLVIAAFCLWTSEKTQAIPDSV